MASPGPITSTLGIETPQQLDVAISKGVLKDPFLVAKAKAEFGAPANPILGAVGAPLPAAPPPMDLAPLGAPAKQPYHDESILPAVPVIPPVAAYVQATGGPPPGGPPPPPKPAPAPPPGPAPKAGSVVLGAPSAPAAPVGGPDFGKLPHHIAAEKQDATHAINTLGYQNQQSDLDAEKADAFEAHAAQIAQDADRRAALAERNAAERRGFLTRFNAETERRIDDYVKADVDPNRFFAKAGEGSRFVAMLGVALSGIGNVFAARGGASPQGNAALDFIERAIAEDIALQKGQIAKQGAGIEARRGLYSSYLQQFGQEDLAEQMAYEGYLRKAKGEVDAQMAKTTNKEVRLRGEALGEALENKIKQMANGRAIIGETNWQNYLNEKAKREAAAAAAAMQPYKDEYALNKGAVQSKIDKTGGFGKYLKPGTQLPNGAYVTNPFGMHVIVDADNNIIDYGTAHVDGAGKIPTVTVPGAINEKGQWSSAGTAEAHSPDAANKYNAVISGAKSGLDAVKMLRDLRKKNGGGSWLPNSEDKAAAIMATGTLFKADKQVGENSDKDAERIEVKLPDAFAKDPKAWIMGGKPLPDALIDQWEAKFSHDIANANSTYLKKPPANPIPYKAPSDK